jgi:hypothetical protein
MAGLPFWRGLSGVGPFPTQGAKRHKKVIKILLHNLDEIEVSKLCIIPIENLD